MGSPSKVSRVVITGHETPVRVGDARRLAATVYDDKGHLVHNAAVTFSVVGTTPALAVVSNDATGGGASLTPLAPGTVASALTLGVGVTSGTLTLTAGDAAALGGATLTLTASGSGVASATATTALTVAAPVVVTPPTSNGVLPVKIGRSGPGTADTLCLGAFFLAPGRLTAAQFTAGAGKLTIGGTEVAFAAAVSDAPVTCHADGSLRMLRVQLPRTALVHGQVTAAVFDVSATRTLSLLTMQDPVPALRNTTGATIFDQGAQGYVVTTDPAENCNSTLFGATRPASEDLTDPLVQQLVQVYETYAPTTVGQETMTGAGWTGTAWGVGSGGTGSLATYEVPMESWDWFARTGDVTYWMRGVAHWCSWGNNYLAAQDGGAAEQYQMPRTYRMAYLALGDPLAKRSEARLATYLNTGYDAERGAGYAVNAGVGRFGARAFEGLAFAMNNEPNLVPVDGFPVFTPDYITMLVGRALNAPGVALSGVFTTPAWTTALPGAGGLRTIQVAFDGNPPDHFGFQAAIYCNALVEVADQLGALLPTALVDLLWSRLSDVVTYWMQQYRYVPGACVGMVGERFPYKSTTGDDPEPNLNGFYWLPMLRVADRKALAGDVAGAHTIRLFVDELMKPATYILAHPGYDSSQCGSGKNGVDFLYAMPKTWHESMHDLTRALAIRARVIAAGA